MYQVPVSSGSGSGDQASDAARNKDGPSAAERQGGVIQDIGYQVQQHIQAMLSSPEKPFQMEIETDEDEDEDRLVIVEEEEANGGHVTCAIAAPGDGDQPQDSSNRSAMIPEPIMMDQGGRPSVIVFAGPSRRVDANSNGLENNSGAAGVVLEAIQNDGNPHAHGQINGARVSQFMQNFYESMRNQPRARSWESPRRILEPLNGDNNNTNIGGQQNQNQPIRISGANKSKTRDENTPVLPREDSAGAGVKVAEVVTTYQKENNVSLVQDQAPNFGVLTVSPDQLIQCVREAVQKVIGANEALNTVPKAPLIDAIVKQASENFANIFSSLLTHDGINRSNSNSANQVNGVPPSTLQAPSSSTSASASSTGSNLIQITTGPNDAVTPPSRPINFLAPNGQNKEANAPTTSQCAQLRQQFHSIARNVVNPQMPIVVVGEGQTYSLSTSRGYAPPPVTTSTSRGYAPPPATASTSIGYAPPPVTTSTSRGYALPPAAASTSRGYAPPLAVDVDSTSRGCYSCVICNAIYKYAGALENHQIFHAGDFTCGHCLKRFLSQRALTLHYQSCRCHPEGNFKCPNCHIGGHKTKEDLIFHKQFLCAKGCAIVNCEDCEKEKNKKAKKLAERFACPRCLMDFSSKYYVPRHYKQHFVPREFKCDTCDVTFNREKDLQHHSHKENGGLFQCRTCDGCFSTWAKLKAHLEAFLDHKKNEENDHDSD